MAKVLINNERVRKSDEIGENRERSRLLADLHLPDAEQIIVSMDNFNTHNYASLYEAFPPEETRRIREKIDIHYTPKHGSWLNMAEIELSVLQRQCLSSPIPDQETLNGPTWAWASRRNQASVTADWQFATADARIKLKNSINLSRSVY